MKITRVETLPITLPVKDDIAIIGSLGAHRTSPYVLVILHTDEGLQGLGEATVTAGWSGETQPGSQAILEQTFQPLLLGRDPFDWEALLEALDRAAPDNWFSKAAVEMALLDLVGKKLQVPLYRLLGGACHDRRIPIKFVVGAREPQEAAQLAVRFVEAGFDTLKIKVGRDPETDVERVKEVRAAVGEKVRLTVDANGGWSVADAVRCLRRMEPSHLLLAEQPVHRQDLEGLAEVRRRVGVPIMADEAVFSLRQALAVLRHRAADIISVYPGKNGGLWKAKQIASVAAQEGVACHVGSNLEWDIGSAAMAHLAVSTPNIRSDLYPADIIGPLYHADRVVKNPLRIEPGFVEVPEGSGLGVELQKG
jgi:muconate cycloisomerase